MALAWLRRRPRRRQSIKLSMFAAVLLWLPFVVGLRGDTEPDLAAGLLAARHVMRLAPRSFLGWVPGWLDRPMNFGYRCTLVDAAAILNYYGATDPQPQLALEMGPDVDYANATQGPPWWAYVAPPGRQSLLDRAIERVGEREHVPVVAQTVLGLSFPRAATAIAADHPVILNMLRTPDGTYNHSLLAYGYDTHGGDARLLLADPNGWRSYWMDVSRNGTYTITTTYIAPAQSGWLV
jgi:hypothetical protein